MEKKRKFNKRYCIAFGCLNSNKKVPDLTLFSLPRDQERRKEWCTLIGREDLLYKENLKYKGYEVCSFHFDESAITTVKQLKPNAVPIRFIGKQFSTALTPATTSRPTGASSPSFDVPILPQVKIEKPDYISIETQTEQQISSEEITLAPMSLDNKIIHKRKLSNNLSNNSEHNPRQLEHELKRTRKEIEGTSAPVPSDAEDDISRRFQKVTNWQNKLRNQLKGNRYDGEYKLFALYLLYSSPQSYQCLQTALKLPRKSTLSRFKLKIPPKLNDQVLERLSMKMKSLPKTAKYCTICIDKMALKRNLYYDVKTDEVVGFHNIDGKTSTEVASNAYVIMLQGLDVEWKQPIAYAFLGSTDHYIELDNWINEVIRKLFRVGIEVMAVISNQESNFDKYATLVKKVTVDKPYFFVGGCKVYYIFDVPHLLKSVRNHLLSNNFHHKEEVISWNYIKTLYEDQKQKNLVLIPNIKDAHVEPNNIQRNNVKYAAQIFSYAVSAALDTYIDFEQISEDARATAKFIKTMNDLYDVLNSSTVKSAKNLQTAFIMSESQKNILEETHNIFATIKCINSNTGDDNTNQIKTFQNFQISIQAVLQLFEDLTKKGFQYLFTRRLNLDSLKHFFGSVRKQGNSYSDLTPIQFTRAFSKLFVMNMLNSSGSTYKKLDINEILMKAEDIMKTKIQVTEEAQTSLLGLDGEIDYRMDLPDGNALTYVAGYLIFKCSEKHNCDRMFQVMKSLPALDDVQLSTDYKAFNRNSLFYGNLRIPPQELNQYVEKLETTFTNNFDKCIQDRPGSIIFRLLKEIPPVKLCPCFPTDYFLKLFVRLRIFATLRFNRLCFKYGDKSRKQYLKVQQL